MNWQDPTTIVTIITLLFGKEIGVRVGQGLWQWLTGRTRRKQDDLDAERAYRRLISEWGSYWKRIAIEHGAEEKDGPPFPKRPGRTVSN